jgi:hypothetical protein
VSRCCSCAACCRCGMRCSRCCARCSIRSCRDGRALKSGGAPRRNSGRGPATRGAAGRGGAAMCGVGRGAIAGRCGGGAGRTAGAAGRTIAGGGAGRAMAGGAAGRAMAGGAAGLAAAAGAAGGPGLLWSWADAPTLAAITQTPSTEAAKRTPTRSIVIAPRSLFGCPPSSTRERRNRSPSRPAACFFDWRCDFATQGKLVRSAGMPKRRPIIPSTPARRAGLGSRPPSIAEQCRHEKSCLRVVPICSSAQSTSSPVITSGGAMRIVCS